MKKYTKNRESQSRTVESNSNGFRQPPISEILQAYRNGTLGRSPIQRESIEEDDDLIQTKTSGQPPVSAILQQYGEKRQKYASEEDEEIVQGKFDTAQRQEKSNNTGLPDNLKSGIENLSGYSMDDVKVHYNSDKPAQLNALAYAQGTNIHVAPGQEKHLPHEAWHVVQQKQGRVQPTMQIQGVNVNDNEGLENEADVMGGETYHYSSKQDGFIISPFISEIAQLTKISITDGEKTIEGKSGTQRDAKENMKKWPTIKSKFESVVVPQKPTSAATENRGIYVCAEPHAFAALLSEHNKMSHPVNKTWFQNVRFTGKAIDDDDPSNIHTLDPCDVCKQWVNSDLTLNPNIIPEEPIENRTQIQSQQQRVHERECQSRIKQRESVIKGCSTMLFNLFHIADEFIITGKNLFGFKIGTIIDDSQEWHDSFRGELDSFTRELKLEIIKENTCFIDLPESNFEYSVDSFKRDETIDDDIDGKEKGEKRLMKLYLARFIEICNDLLGLYLESEE